MPDNAELFESLESGSLETRRQAAEQLAQSAEGVRWGPGALSLVRAAADEDEAIREWAVAALEGMGAPHDADALQLAATVGSDCCDEAYWAVTLLGRLGPRGAVAVPQLAAAVTAHPELPVRQRAAWALGQMGAAARPAESALQEAASSSDARLARLASDALRQLTA